MTEPKPTPSEIALGGARASQTGWRAAPAKAAAAARSTPGKLLVGLTAVGLLAVGAGVTSAEFNDEVKIGVDVAAGSLNINIDGAEGNPTPVKLELPLSLFKPGDTATKTVEVRNTGTLPEVVTTKMTGTGAGALGAQLDSTLTAAPAGAAQVTVSAKANAASLGAFTVPGGGAVPLTVTLTLPANTDNTWQGRTDTLTLTLTAVQE